MELFIIVGAWVSFQTHANPLPDARQGAGATPSASEEAMGEAVLEPAERAARSAEAWELQGRAAIESGGQAEELRRAVDRLSQYLKAQPEDVRALLLKARLQRALIVVTPVVISLDDNGRGSIENRDMAGVRNDALATLERVIQLNKGNGEAHYWKARTLMLSSRGAVQVGAEEARDPMPALAAARQAVSLDPTNSAYREYLALVLYGIGERDEALRELAKLPGKHPILQLLDDMKAIPTPGGSELDEGLSIDILKQIFSGRLDVFKYPGLRTKTYAFASPVAAVKASYAESFPGIHWAGSGKDEPAYAAFVWREGKLEPINDHASFMGNFEEQLPPSGILLSLLRDEADPDRTTLFIINFRRF